MTIRLSIKQRAIRTLDFWASPHLFSYILILFPKVILTQPSIKCLLQSYAPAYLTLIGSASWPGRATNLPHSQPRTHPVHKECTCGEPSWPVQCNNGSGRKCAWVCYPPGMFFEPHKQITEEDRRPEYITIIYFKQQTPTGLLGLIQLALSRITVVDVTV
jgi:hypothetical protein